MVFLALTFGVVVVGTFLATPQYEGTTKVIIEKVESSDLSGPYHASRYDPEFYATQFQLIKSTPVAHRVVDMLGLGDKIDQLTGSGQNSILHSVQSRFTIAARKAMAFILPNQAAGKGTKVLSKEDLAAQAISQGISVTPVNDSHIVTISFLSPNPELAAQVANATAKAYIEETLDMKMESTRRTLAWMTRKAGEEAKKLDKTENALQAYRKANDIVTLENRLTITPGKLSEVSTQLVQAETKRKELEVLDRKVRQAARDPSVALTIAAVADDPSVQTLRSQIIDSEKNIMELSGKFGPKHPVMTKALGDLKILKQKRNQAISRVIQSIRNQYELARANENNLHAELQRTKNEAQRLNEKFIQYNAMNREVDTSRQLYDALLTKLKEQSLTQETQPVNLSVVEEASVPLFPARPLKGLNLLLGLFLGLFGGIGLAFFFDYLDNTVKSPEETEASLGIPVLGVVPLCKGNDQDLEEMFLKDPQSLFSEHYRALRTSILLSSADAPPASILVTSPAMGEGKTTISVNLALALAQSEKKVVLIDGDLRKPRIHKIFKMNNENGLSVYLAGSAGKDILKKGPVANLAVMTSGPMPPNPSELLGSNRMKTLLEGLRKDFDIIICDSPPVLSVADPRILSRIFDSVIVVARAHKTNFDISGQTLKSLHDVNAHVLGMVINALDYKKSDYYQYDYYTSYRQKQHRVRTGEA